MTDRQTGQNLCFRRDCGNTFVAVVSSGYTWITKLCRPCESELHHRAQILGGYSLVNTEDAAHEFDNPWGWKLDA
jgi:hypothetical protein